MQVESIPDPIALSLAEKKKKYENCSSMSEHDAFSANFSISGMIDS